MMYMYYSNDLLEYLFSVIVPQQVLQLRHQNEALENEIDLLKKQITFRDEFIEVRQTTKLYAVNFWIKGSPTFNWLQDQLIFSFHDECVCVCVLLNFAPLDYGQ